MGEHIHIKLNEATPKERLAQQLAGLLTSRDQESIRAALGDHPQAVPLSTFARNYPGRPEAAYEQLIFAGYTVREMKAAVKMLAAP